MSDEFEALVAKYHNLVMSLLRRYYGGRLGQDVDDLAQEVWIKLWERFKKNESNIVDFKSYLYRTVQTCAWDAVHRLDKQADVTADLHGEDAVPSDLGEGDRRDRRLVMEQLTQTLKPTEARVIRAYLQGFDYAETAELLGVSEGRVRNLLTRLKKKMAIRGER